MQQGRAIWVVYATLAMALWLHLLPLPLDWRAFKPPVVEVTLFYWVLALPHRVGVLTSAATGVLLDLLAGSPIGALSLGLVSATLILLFNYQRIRQFDPLQQTLAMTLLLALVCVVERWGQTLAGPVPAGSRFLLPAVAVPVLWPLLRAILRSVRRYWEVG